MPATAPSATYPSDLDRYMSIEGLTVHRYGDWLVVDDGATRAWVQVADVTEAAMDEYDAARTSDNAYDHGTAWFILCLVVVAVHVLTMFRRPWWRRPGSTSGFPASRTDSKVRALDLFAGCGGASLGLGQAGLEVVADYERDPDACATLAAAGLHPVRCDLADVRGWDLPAVDLWWASPPCQPDSSAGKRQGADDDRDGWPHVLRLLAEAGPRRPRWLVCETVRGILPPKRIRTEAHQRRADRWSGILAGLRMHFAWVMHRVLDAADYGVPQHRRRVITVCGPRPIVWPEPTHGAVARCRCVYPDSCFCDKSRLPWVSMGEALGLGDHRADRPSTTIAAQHGGGAGNAGSPTSHHAPYVPSDQPPWWHRASPPDEPSRTIGTRANASVLLEPARTVTTGEVKGASQRGGRADHPKEFSRASDQLMAGTGRRRLTVEECLILQDLPGHPVQGRTKASRYRQAGNAVPPRLAEVVALAITTSR